MIKLLNGECGNAGEYFRVLVLGISERYKLRHIILLMNTEHSLINHQRTWTTKEYQTLRLLIWRLESSLEKNIFIFEQLKGYHLFIRKFVLENISL